MTWTAVDTATGYTVQWTSGGEGYNTGDRQAPVTSGSTTRHTIPSLINGTEYTVRVIATRTGVTDGPPSEEMTGTPRVPPPPPPPPVTDLAQVMGVGVAPGNAQLVVTWTAVDTATGYTVQWTSGGEGYNTGDRQAPVTSGSTTRHTIPSLINGTEYTVRVIATRTGVTDGPPSEEVTGRPRVPPPPPPPPVTDLAQVMGVGVAPGNAQLVVTWTAVDTATGYTVQWTSGGEGYNTGDRQATVTSESTTRYTIPSLINGTAYTVRVIATRTGVTDGPPSEEMTGTPRVPPPPPPPPVTDLAQVMGVGVAPGNAQLVVTWDGGGHRHGLHGAVDVGQPGLQHRRPAGPGHVGVDHTLHDSQPYQRHGIHSASDRDPDGRHRRPALGGGDGDARHHARRAAAPAGGAGRRAGDAALGGPGERRRVPDPPVRVCDRRQRDLDRRGRRPGGNSAGPDERAVVRRRGAGGERGRCWPVGGGDRDARHHARRAAAPAVGAGRRAGDAALGGPGERRRVPRSSGTSMRSTTAGPGSTRAATWRKRCGT